MNPDDRAVALVAAHDEEATVGATVRALAALPGLAEVVVVDDGSRDRTAGEALAAGATVLRIGSRIGKGGALEGALRRLPAADAWLFADADLGGTAGALGPLLAEVRGGHADLAIAVFPPGRGGGFGIVNRAAGRVILAMSGVSAVQPLSGQRALTTEALAVSRPLARGFGVETAMTIDVARAGLRVHELPIAGLSHRATGRDVAGFLHRGRQGLDIGRAAGSRVLRRRPR